MGLSLYCGHTPSPAEELVYVSVFHRLILFWSSSRLFRLSLTSTCSTPSVSFNKPTIPLFFWSPLRTGGGAIESRRHMISPFLLLSWLSFVPSVCSASAVLMTQSPDITVSGAFLYPAADSLPGIVAMLLSNKYQLTKNGELISEQRRVGAPAIKKPFLSLVMSLLLWITGGLLIGSHTDWAWWLVDKAAIVYIGLVFLCWVRQNSAASCFRPRLLRLACLIRTRHSDDAPARTRVHYGKTENWASGWGWSLHGEVKFTSARRRSQNGDLDSDCSARTDGWETDAIFQLPHWSLYLLCFHQMGGCIRHGGGVCVAGVYPDAFGCSWSCWRWFFISKLHEKGGEVWGVQ